MNLYIDMDGVLADFDNAFVSTFGVDHRTGMGKKEMWKHVHSHPNFFLSLPLIKGAKALVQYAGDLWEACRLDQVHVLTACPSSAYDRVALQKIAWVRKHFDLWHTHQAGQVMPVMGSENKPLFMHQPGDILIDDWGKNIAAWEAHGGKGIKFENAEQAIAELRSAIK